MLAWLCQTHLSFGSLAGEVAEVGGTDVVTDSNWRTTFRPDIPSSARIYDYFLGGKDNFPADREAGDEIISYLPDICEAARFNRAFVGRVVRFLVKDVGVTQLIDIGTGLPTQGNVHEVAKEANPAAQIVYVDHDPVVLAHARDLLDGDQNAVITEHDMQDPEGILADPELREKIDFSQPVGTLYVSMLHFVSGDDDPGGIIRRLLDPFPSGSYVALTHATADPTPLVWDVARVYNSATTQLYPRTKAEVLDLVAGLDVVEPGIVWTPLWRPDPGDAIPADPSHAYYYAVVARKR
jgi:S-adenosyl methyltransferase